MSKKLTWSRQFDVMIFWRDRQHCQYLSQSEFNLVPRCWIHLAADVHLAGVLAVDQQNNYRRRQRQRGSTMAWSGFLAIRTDYSDLHPLADRALSVWAVIIYIEFQAAAVSFGSRKKAEHQRLLAILTVTSKKLTWWRDHVNFFVITSKKIDVMTWSRQLKCDHAQNYIYQVRSN